MIRFTAYDPKFYAFSRTLEAYKEGQNKNSARGEAAFTARIGLELTPRTWDGAMARSRAGVNHRGDRK